MADETWDPQVISLEDVRARRQAEAERAARSRAEATRQAWEEHALTEAILAKRMHFVELTDMLRLGIVTDDAAYLPCEDRRWPEEYYKWVRQSKGLHFEGEAEEDARPRRPDEPEWVIEERTRPKPRHTVGCPLMAAGIIPEESPPCIEVLRMQASQDLYGKEGLIRKELDGTDLIVQHEVRPCVVLGRQAMVAVMRPVWQRREQDPK